MSNQFAFVFSGKCENLNEFLKELHSLAEKFDYKLISYGDSDEVANSVIKENLRIKRFIDYMDD